MSMTYGSSGSALTSAQATAIANIKSPLASNLSATASPTVSDDSTKGYAVGSTWIYSGSTYTCTDATVGAAAWALPTDIYYFQDWTSLVAAINVTDSTYINKYVSVANANGGPSVIGATYTAPASIATPIADGNAATYKVLAEGSGVYSVKLSQRPPTAFRVTSVMTVAAVKPTTAGYYIFRVTPSNGLPASVNLNDIANLAADNTTWSVYQSWANADVTVPVGTSATTITTWKKTISTWTDEMPNVLTYGSGSVTTWIPTPGMKYAIAEVQAAGGSGASVLSTATTDNWAAGSGGAGSYAKVLITAAQAGASKVITVGPAGTPPGVQGNGQAGSTASIGTLVSCPGGFGGVQIRQAVGTVAVCADAAATLPPTISGCTTIESFAGQGGPGISGCFGSTGLLTPNGGGRSKYGGGGSYVGSGSVWTALSGTAAESTHYGAGGFARVGYGNAGLQSGGSGIGGIVTVTEYF